MYMLIGVVVLSAAICQINGEQKNCEKKNINTCVKEYKRAVLDGKDHCGRLQVMISCLARDSLCTGEVIASFREWMLQLGLMDKIMSKCPPSLDTSTLDSLLKTTRLFNPELHVDSVSKDSLDTAKEPCALTAHNFCVKNYIEDIHNKKDLCTAVEGLNQCYKNVVQGGLCNAAIIKHFEKILDKLAVRVTRVLHNAKNFPNICKKVTKSEL